MQDHRSTNTVQDYRNDNSYYQIDAIVNDQIDAIVNDDYVEDDITITNTNIHDNYLKEKFQYINFKDTLQILVVSWNVGNAVPNEIELYSLLNLKREKKPDMIVIGVQECSYTATVHGKKKAGSNANNSSAVKTGSSLAPKASIAKIQKEKIVAIHLV